jgi:hypothetical protein
MPENLCACDQREPVRQLTSTIVTSKRTGSAWGNQATDDTKATPDLDDWRAEAGACAPLDAAATRGPWLTIEEAPSWDTPNAVGYDSREHHRGPPYYATGVRCGSIEQAESDGRFIAAARTGWPRVAARVGALCAEVERLQSLPSQLRAAFQDPAGDWPTSDRDKLRRIATLLGIEIEEPT